MFGQNLMSQLFGMNIFETPLAVTPGGPKRIHKKRRNQTVAYHKRIQKKWNKRFGVAPDTPAIFMIPNGGFHVHPLLMDQLKAETKKRAAYANL